MNKVGIIHMAFVAIAHPLPPPSFVCCPPLHPALHFRAAYCQIPWKTTSFDRPICQPDVIATLNSPRLVMCVYSDGLKKRVRQKCTLFSLKRGKSEQVPRQFDVLIITLGASSRSAAQKNLPKDTSVYNANIFA